MPLLVRCPACKKLLAASAKVCRSKTGKGCGAKIPAGLKNYYLQWMEPDGRTHQKSIGHLLAKEARLKEAKAMNDLAQGRRPFQTRKEGITVGEFIDAVYWPWVIEYNRAPKTKRHRLTHIRRQWGKKKLSALADKDIDKFRHEMQVWGTLATFNRVMSVLGHMFTIALERGYIREKPINTAKGRFKEKGRLRYLLPEELDRLVAECPAYIRPIVLTAAHTGLRRTELLRLRLGLEVDLQTRRITVRAPKTEETRHIPINETLAAVLTEAAQGKATGDYIFAKPNGDPRVTIRRPFGHACQRAEIHDFKLHDLRHTFASNLVMAGVDLATVRELLGHKTMAMTLRYSHLSPAHQSRAVGVLDRVFGGGKRPVSISCVSVVAPQKQPDYTPYEHKTVAVGR